KSSSTKPTTTSTRPASKDEVAVTVNGHAIMESEVESLLQKRFNLASRPGRPMDENRLNQLRQRYRQQMMDSLVREQLLKNELADKKITINDADLENKVEELIEITLEARSMTREELINILKTRQNMTLKQLVDNTKTQPQVTESVKWEKLIAAVYPDKIKVSDEEVKKYYEDNLEKTYKKPPMVKASHILIRCGPSDGDEKKTAARKQMEEILKEAKKKDADFAALAQKHSECPSKADGGNLGYFPRKSAPGQRGMVEPFAAAAFALKTGEISDIVETQFGYHIIKVTDKKDAETIPLAKARDLIQIKQKQNKLQPLIRQHAEDLKNSAKIVYPKGKEPKVTTVTTRPATAPASRPARASRPAPASRPARSYRPPGRDR
ncbi:MAG: peptidylprolyl isomerase, partial [Planctomycetota bacterium]